MQSNNSLNNPLVSTTQSTNEADLPTRIVGLENAIKSVENSIVELRQALGVSGNVPAELMNFLDGIFSKYFRQDYEAFKTKISGK